MTGSESAFTSTSVAPKALRYLEAVPAKRRTTNLNNNLGLLIANITQPEAAVSLLASRYLSDAICVKPEALMTDPVWYPETPSISDAPRPLKHANIKACKFLAFSLARLLALTERRYWVLDSECAPSLHS
jgi:hypothetical protein